MSIKNCDVLILGGGMVGLSIAHQLGKRGITNRITIIEKESQLGLHSSGRNSGVLHAGLYYKPGSLKSQVCVEGGQRLRAWVEERGLPINKCGKVIVPTRPELDKQLDTLAERGKANGADVYFWDEKKLKEVIPEARTASNRAIWSPNTAVVHPRCVIKELTSELNKMGVEFRYSAGKFKIKPDEKQLELENGEVIKYGHLYNCTGLHADRIAKQFGVGENYMLIPFKGLYWKLKSNCPFKPKTNLYPVPDLNVPFLGVHFTPSADQNPVVSIGPTATPALGRENYKGLQSIEAAMTTRNATVLARQYIANKGGFRRYVHEQLFLSLKPMLLKAAQELIPKLRSEHIELSEKVGIRSQVFNRRKTE